MFFICRKSIFFLFLSSLVILVFSVSENDRWHLVFFSKIILTKLFFFCFLSLINNTNFYRSELIGARIGTRLGKKDLDPSSIRNHRSLTRQSKFKYSALDAPMMLKGLKVL